MPVRRAEEKKKGDKNGDTRRELGGQGNRKREDSGGAGAGAGAGSGRAGAGAIKTYEEGGVDHLTRECETRTNCSPLKHAHEEKRQPVLSCPVLSRPSRPVLPCPAPPVPPVPFCPALSLPSLPSRSAVPCRAVPCPAVSLVVRMCTWTRQHGLVTCLRIDVGLNHQTRQKFHTSSHNPLATARMTVPCSPTPACTITASHSVAQPSHDVNRHHLVKITKSRKPLISHIHPSQPRQMSTTTAAASKHNTRSKLKSLASDPLKAAHRCGHVGVFAIVPQVVEVAERRTVKRPRPVEREVKDRSGVAVTFAANASSQGC
eukprot:519568-Hanusia_phi.AAC.4